MLEKLRKTIAKAIAPSRAKPAEPRARRSRKAPMGLQTRMYQAAKQSRMTAGWAPTTTSADSELSTSLTALRNRCRALVRDAAYAKRAKVIVQNNVVGSGIGMQAQVMTTRDELRESVNDAIEEAWEDWSYATYCHTGGTLCFADFERALMGQVFEAGEVFVRKYYRSFGGSEIPFALELIEAERVADDLTSPVMAPIAPGAMVKMGVEMDHFGRPIAYWIRRRHPGEFRFIFGETDQLERVPAEQVIHLRITDRWPQTRGEPWLHAVARKLNDMDGYSEAEIIAARASANQVFTIETPDANSGLAGQEPAGGSSAGADISKEFVVEPGMGMRLAPGEKFAGFTPTRPNTALDPFMRYMLREIAAGTGPSYESLSRDYSQSNYSSSRLALLDDRDLWRMLQQWFIRNFRRPLHAEWLQAAVLSGSVPGISLEEYGADPGKFEAVLFKPRGWGWIDPTKEVAAYEAAVKAGFTTRADVIAATADGRDIEDNDRQRERELKREEQMQLEFTTSPSVYIPAATGSQKGTGMAGAPDEGEPGGPQGEDPNAADPNAADPASESPPGDGNEPKKNGPPLRAISIRR